MKNIRIKHVFFVSRATLMFPWKSRSLRNSELLVTICSIRAPIYLPHLRLSWRQHHAHPCAIFLSVHLFPREHHSFASSNWSTGQDIGYREKKNLDSSGDLYTRCMIDMRRQCPDVARLVGAKSEDEGKEMRMDGQTDGQTGGQKVKCPQRRIKWRFRIRPLSFVRPSGRWKRWKGCPPPFGITPEGSTCK